MKSQNKPWIDKLIKKTLKNEIPVETMGIMENQISEFYKKMEAPSDGFFLRRRKIFTVPPSLMIVKNGLLTLGFLAGIVILPQTSTVISREISTTAFVHLKYKLTLLAALDEIEEVEAEISFTFENGSKRELKITWKNGKWMPASLEERAAWLKPFLSPASLKKILRNHMILSEEKKGLSFLILNQSEQFIGSISLKEDDFLPECLDGVVGPDGEIVKIIYRWKETAGPSLVAKSLKRRKKDE